MTNEITVEQENAVKRFYQKWLQNAGQVFDENGDLLTHQELLGSMASDFDALASDMGVDYDEPVFERRTKYDAQDLEVYGSLKGAFDLLLKTDQALQDPFMKGSALFGDEERTKISNILGDLGELSDVLGDTLNDQLNPYEPDELLDDQAN